ncbi:MAG: hypothetical protein SCALA702_31040 [Melioribacteraceae bacterium]|nr:MAG: hypothetical protein SCALA702_31040 [Melioribacteraceae bacterium]
MLYRTIYILLLLAISLAAQNNIFLVTYGPEAETREGDADYSQIIYLKIPSNISDMLFLRVYDADCGGRNDSPFGPYDTETRYRLIGKAGNFNLPSLLEGGGLLDNIDATEFLVDTTLAEDPFLDNKWYNLAQFNAAQGKLQDNYYYFKLVITGMTGNDGNVLNVALSNNSKSNDTPPGVEILSYEPTIRLPRAGIFAELKFFTPEDMDSIIVYNFDAANAKIDVNTRFRDDLRIKSSGQDEWASGVARFNSLERDRFNAVVFREGNEIPNDATFFLLSPDGNPVPFVIPVPAQQPNKHPGPVFTYKVLSDCFSVVFDASESYDPDDNAMNFYWDFGDGKTGEGVRIAHVYEKIDTFNVTLIVEDESGVISNSAITSFIVGLNYSPVANAGNDIVIAPGEAANFNASGSTDSDGKIMNYYWEFGDGSDGTGITTSHVYDKVGRYPVLLRVEDDSDSPCNFGTDKISVWVNSPPEVEIGADKIAAVGQEVDFNGGQSFDSDGEITEYMWDYGDGNTGYGVVSSHTYSNPGKYKVTLKITDNTTVSNNSASDVLTVVVNDRPVAEAGNDLLIAADETFSLNGNSTRDNDGKIIDFNWELGDGAVKNGAVISHSYDQPGVYKVKLTVQDDSKSISDKNSDSLQVVVNFPPVAEAGKEQLVTESLVQFDGSSSSDQDGSITAYRWDFGDGKTSEEMSPTHIYENPGEYDVKLVVTDDSKTLSQYDSSFTKVTVNEKPIANAGGNQVAAPGENLTFDGSNSVDRDGSVSKYIWNFGDGKTGEGATVNHTFEKPGIYTVTLEVVDNTNHPLAKDYDELTVTVNAPPVAIAGKDIFASPGDEIVFDSGESFDIDGNIEYFNWKFSDGNGEANSPSVSRSFEKPGIYYADLMVRDNLNQSNSVSLDRVNIFINHTPNADPGEDIITCSNEITFDGSSSGDPDGDALTYIWDFGDGSPKDTGITITHLYEESGTYPVILTVVDNHNLANSSNSSSMTVTINLPPVANAGKDKTICAGDIVLFDAGNSYDPEGGLLKFFWDFGDGTKAEGMNPTKNYKQGGVYNVSLYIKDDSGLPCNYDIDKMVVTVAESPTADAGQDQVVCANTVVEFDGSGSFDFDGVVNNYSWDFGDGNTGGGAKPTHVFTEPGEYRVLLTITGDLVGDCDNMDKDECIITVLDAPEAAMSFVKKVAVNSPVQFDASESQGNGSEILNYNWDMGDGTTLSGKEIVHKYTTHGKFFIKMNIETDSKAQCSSAPTQDYIIVNAPPVAVAGKDTIVDINSKFVLSASESYDPDGAIKNYIWEFDDGITDSGIVVQHQFLTAGNHQVILTVIDESGIENDTAIDTINVFVKPKNDVSLAIPDWACPGDSVTLSVFASGDENIEYVWNPGNGNTITGKSVLTYYELPGTYNISLTAVDKSGEQKTKTVFQHKIIVNRAPFFTKLPDKIVCPGEEVVYKLSDLIDRDGSISEISWNTGDGNTLYGETFNYSYNVSGKYDLIVEVKDNSQLNCGVTRDTVTIICNTSPEAFAGGDKSGFTGGAHDALYFDASGSKDADGDALTYKWDFGDGNSREGKVVSHYYEKPGIYQVKLIVNDGTGTSCSSAQDVINVEIKLRR